MSRNLRALPNSSNQLSVVHPKNTEVIGLAEAGYDEEWLLGHLLQNTQSLGFGAYLESRDNERLRPKGSHVDILFQCRESETRYCVEAVLGEAKESDLVRVIEFWDRERSQSYNYKHVPVLIAEDVPNNFLTSHVARNVPLVVIKMEAIKLEDQFVLNLSRVLDYTTPKDSDNTDARWQSSTRKAWLDRCTPGAIKAIDEWIDLCRGLDEGLKVLYHKQHIALRGNVTNNFSWPYARENCEGARIEMLCQDGEREKVIAELDQAGVSWQISRQGNLRFDLKPGEIENKKTLFKSLAQTAIRSAK